MPTKYVPEIILYPSETHTIEAIGKNPELNVTELAVKLGVTKGTISKALRKLQDKKMVEKYKSADNKKEIFLKLTENGKKVFDAHEKYHQNFYCEINQYLERLNAEEKTVVKGFLEKSEDLLDEFIKKNKILSD
jgi:DNA-binding MarR family transcriptional regulator